MGVVCEATHIGLEAPVAIKFIRTDLKNDTEYVQRFLNEARHAAALTNEHVARVHDVGQLDSGDLYLVMERLEGIGLDALIREQGPLQQAEAVSLIRQACEGLSEAHAAGIIHRDIKPENLFLARRSDGKRTLKILDFGISKQTSGDAPSSLTNSERSLGSPWYMSPEQMIDTSSVDHRADVWSLGVVLFQLLTAALPFAGSSVPEVCAKVLTAPAPGLRELRPDIDPALEAIVARCLAKEPSARPDSVGALSAELEPFASPRDTPPDPAPESLDPAAEDAFFNRAEESAHRTTPVPLAPLSRRSVQRLTLARTLGGLGILATVTLAAGAFLRTRAEAPNEAPPTSPTLAPAAPPTPATPSAERSLTLPAPPVVLPAPPQSQPSSQPSSPAAGEEQRGTSPTPPEGEKTAASPRATEAPEDPRKPPTAAAPSLTPEEILRRKERYERWLREQGLQRLDEVEVPRQAEPPPEQGGD